MNKTYLSLFSFAITSILAAQGPFVTTWKTDNAGGSEDNQITIPTFSDKVYDYPADWGNGTSDTNVTGDIAHIYTFPGTYQVSRSGEFPRVYFKNSDDASKIVLVNAWGDIE